MSIYKKLNELGSKFIPEHVLFKQGFNFSPMYRRSTGRVTTVAKDLKHVEVSLKVSWKNRNYMNSIFGGSLFSAVDPIPMIQLVYILGKNYVVWDKSAEIGFFKPAKANLQAKFSFTDQEISELKSEVIEKGETTIDVITDLKGFNDGVTYASVKKTIYVADKEFFKKKRAARKVN